jgi:hypothetical protein
MNLLKKSKDKIRKENVWARPNMIVTFRLEVMPGRTREERTFRVQKVLPNGRVVLENFSGEHREGAFERTN